MYSYPVLDKDDRKRKTLSIDDIFDDVCAIFNQYPHQVISKSRKRKYLFCRYIISHVSYSLCNVSFKAIGEYLGDRDHSTILTSIETTRQLIDIKDHDFMEYWNEYVLRSKIWQQYSNQPINR